MAVARRCLSAGAADRYPDGRAVADAAAAYRSRVDQRLKQAETERAEAVVREAEQRRRRKVMQWAGGIIAAVLLAGVAGTSLMMVEAWRQEGLAMEQEAAALKNATEAKRQEHIAMGETADKVKALAAETAALRAAEEALAESRRRALLCCVAYGQLCATASRLANMTDHAESGSVRAEFEWLVDSFADLEDARFVTALTEYRTELARWTVGPPPASLARKSLELARRSKIAWGNMTGASSGDLAAKIRTRLYRRALEVVRAIPSVDIAVAEQARRNFWSLYWGELALVESHDVEQAMVGIGNVLNRWKLGELEHANFAPAVQKLREACSLDGDSVPVNPELAPAPRLAK